MTGCSGSTTDRRDAMRALSANFATDPVDVIIGDWMSEANMTSRGVAKTDAEGDAYEPTFLEALGPALPHIAKHGIKVAANAGASDTRKLHEIVTKMVEDQGLDLKVAWISGDEVLPAVQKALESGQSQFENICTGEILKDWNFEPTYAQAYLGGLGIAEAFARGADIVVCGRVSDAAPVIGAAYWWHNWTRSDLLQLANAFVAGHLIECSNYVCGGNFSGFKRLASKGWDDIGYPIAEISSSGAVVITKNLGTGGEVSVETCTSQLLYEIQGPWYFNSDVTALLSDLWFEQLSTDRVALHGVKADLPPPTTKVGITAKGGYQAEFHWFLVGLDIKEKATMMESQIRKMLSPHIHRFSKLAFTTNGSVPENPTNQNAATVDFRVFAQAPNAKDLMPERFLRPCMDPVMEGYPGATPHLDFRQAFPRPIYEYYVTLLPQADLQHKVHMHTGEEVEVAPPSETKVWPKQQPSLGQKAAPTASLGPCGSHAAILARSGLSQDKWTAGWYIRLLSL
ncbi:hypothetical protein IWX50DRAFT_660898 [Phyllosticta citricarpa]